VHVQTVYGHKWRYCSACCRAGDIRTANGGTKVPVVGLRYETRPFVFVFRVLSSQPPTSWRFSGVAMQNKGLRRHWNEIFSAFFYSLLRPPTASQRRGSRQRFCARGNGAMWRLSPSPWVRIKSKFCDSSFSKKRSRNSTLLNLHVRPKGPSKRCSRPAHGLDVLVLVIAFVFFVKPINRAPT
jgi:hypothetical protein